MAQAFSVAVRRASSRVRAEAVRHELRPRKVMHTSQRTPGCMHGRINDESRRRSPGTECRAERCSSREEITHAAELGVPLLDELVRGEGGERLERLRQAFAQQARRAVGVFVSSTGRLADDSVDQSQLEQLLGGES